MESRRRASGPSTPSPTPARAGTSFANSIGARRTSMRPSHAPFVSAVHSGGKSLHGWFDVHGEDEKKIKWFFRYAVSLGADPATWTRSQFVRMPGGRRDNGKAQLLC